ncbi:hypothetical protein, partial [Micromonospora sp. 15K316]|uniref:hypothetical protein n=1 Tax=Micromonospora sp. 15K316 TaxID=2530376 RepID=UPI001FB58259
MSSGSERGQAGRDPARPDQERWGGAAAGRREDAPERHVREGRWPTEADRPLRPGEPDVLLDVPELRVGELRLAVDGLDADLSLRARLANLVVLDAGVRVRLDAVELDVKDVLAEVLLKVRLERLAEILERALDTLDRNPQLIEAIADSAHAALDDAGRAAQQVTGRAEQLDRVADRLGRDVGSISARAEWTGEGPIAREVSQPSRPERPGEGGAARPAARPGGEPQREPGAGGQRPQGPPAGGEARRQQSGGEPQGREPGAGGQRPQGPQAGREARGRQPGGGEPGRAKPGETPPGRQAGEQPGGARPGAAPSGQG